jgi:hypothetical protein
MTRALSDFAVTPRVRKALVAALDNTDPTVYRGAALSLAFNDYNWRFKIAEWDPPSDDPVAAKIGGILEADEILRGLSAGSAQARQKVDDIAKLLAGRPRGSDSRPYRFQVSREGHVEPILAPGQDPNDPIIQLVKEQYRYFDWKRFPRLPLTFQLKTWTADKAYVYIVLLTAE